MAVLNCPDVQSAWGGRTSQRACVKTRIRWDGRTSRNERTGARRGAEAGLVGSGGADCRTYGRGRATRPPSGTFMQTQRARECETYRGRTPGTSRRA